MVNRFLATAGILVVGLSVCGFAKVRDTRVVPLAPQVVSSFAAAPGAHYPFRENMYRALQLPDGPIIALSIARQDGQQVMQGRFSTDDGRTWSAPQDLFQWPRDAGGFALFDALVDHDGEIHIFILCDANSGVLYPKSQEAQATRPGQILDIWYARSRGGRARWDIPKAIWTGHGSDLLSVIQLRNGRLLLPYASKHERGWGRGLNGGGFGDFTYFGTYSVSALYSDDGGATWHVSPDDLAVQTPDLFTYGADEPVVLQLKDGRVWMLMRTQRGRFYESFSSDGGAHWSQPQPSSLISSDSPAGLLRLKDGKILLFSNACLRYPYAYGARYVLHVAVSDDEGHTWRGFREVARDLLRNEPPTGHEDYGLSYTFPTLTKDGQVLFSNWVQSGRERSFRLLDPAWVYETRQSTDFSAGVDDWSTFGSKGVSVVADPENSIAKVMALQRQNTAWPAAAVWNFPVGYEGKLRMTLMLRQAFGGAVVGLTDHFSVPWDPEDQFYNTFNFPIAADGHIFPNVKLVFNRWYDVEFEWDTVGRHCRVSVNGKPAGILEDNRRSAGVSYLRIRSVSERPDSGMLIRSVAADVSASWNRAQTLADTSADFHQPITGDAK